MMTHITKISAMKWQDLYQNGDPVVQPFYASTAGELPDSALHRPNPLTAEALQEWRSFLESHAPISPLEQELLDKLAHPQARVVITGQQAGAGLGPLYTIYKAIGTVQMAERAEEKLKVPVVPVFWIASDDHDIDEAANFTWADKAGNLQRARLVPEDQQPGPAVWRCPVHHDLAEAIIQRLEEDTNETEFRPEILQDLRDAWLSEGATIESQFLTLFRRWVTPGGILAMVPRLNFIREAALPLLKAEAAESSPTNALVMDEGKKLEALGVTPPLHRKGDEINFFYEQEHAREKMVRLDNGIAAGSIQWSAQEFQKEIADHPDRFSPNAILRPLVQDMALPTIAYIPGPTELVYHGQMGRLYKAFDVPRPALIPRPNVAIVEKKISKAIEKLGWELDSPYLISAEAIQQGLKDLASGNNTAKTFEARILELRHELEKLTTFLNQEFPNQPAISKSIDKLKGGIDIGTEKLAERVLQEINQRDEQLPRAGDRVTQALYPGGAPQERALSPIAPYLINHGTNLFCHLYKETELNKKGFQMVLV